MLSRSIDRICVRMATAPLLVLIILAFAAGVAAQNTRTRRPSVRPTPTPTSAEPAVISRADDLIAPTVVLPEAQDVIESQRQQQTQAPPPSSTEFEALIQALRTSPRDKFEDKQKRLLMNLDILTRAEQRVESLRKQRFELIDKENDLRAKLERTENDLRPEMIERTTSLLGSLRPEEIREARRKNLEADRTGTQRVLAEVQSSLGSLEQSLHRAETLVERLRTKLEKDIDDALADDEPQL